MKTKQQTILDVEGMTCPSCVRQIDQALRDVGGVTHVDVSLLEGRVLVDHDGAELASLIGAVQEAGYDAQPAAPSAETTSRHHGGVAP